MALLRVLAFDHEGRPVQFDTWLDDLHLYLQSDSKDSVSLFDLTSVAATAPPATAQALYDTVVTRYSSPASAALGRLLLPYLFLELSAFATVEELVSHLNTSDARYHATVPAEFLDRNQPLMFITLYFIVTRLHDSLPSVKDHFLSRDPTSLTVDLLEQHLLVAKNSAVAVGAARGTPRPPFFEGCSPSPLAPSYASAAAADVPGTEDVGASPASAKHRNSNGKGSKGGGGGSASGGGGSSGGSGGGGGGGSGGSGGGSGGVGGGGGGSDGSGGSGGGETGSGETGGGGTSAQRGGSGGGQGQQQQRRSETQSPQRLCEWLFQRGTSGGSVSCLYVIRTGDRAGHTCGRLQTQHRCFSRLDDTWCAEFGDECYRCVPPDPGIAAAALSASESSLPGTVPAEALHTFTLDSGASHCFFCDTTTLTPLPGPVLVRLADPSGGPVVARSSTVLLCPALNLWPRVSLLETSPTLRWTGKVGDASVFRDVTFDELVPFYRLFPYRSAPLPPPPLFLAPGPPPVDPLPPQGPAPLGVSRVDPPPDAVHGEVAVHSGAARGTASGGAEPGGAEPGGAEPRSEGAEYGGAEPQGAASSGGSVGALPRLSPQQLREWFVRRALLRSGATGAGGAGATGAVGVGVLAGAGVTGGARAGGVGGTGAGDPTQSGAAGAGDSCAGGAGAGGVGVGGIGARVVGVGGTGTGGAGVGGAGAGGARPRGVGAVDPGGASSGLSESRKPASRPVSPVRTARRVPRSPPPPVPGMHAMALRPSFVPLRVPLPHPLESSLPAVPYPEFDLVRSASPTVSRLLATVITNPSFESTAASALIAELLDFAAACHLDYATALVAESKSTSPLPVMGECALGTDVLEDRQKDFECLAAAVPRFSSMLLAPEGDPNAPDISIPRTYAEAITGPH
ncbi:unnamed protein product [Closterium sp. NIES-54]